MLKKKVFISIALVIGLLFASKGVMAAETTSTTINGATINWEYELNEAGEVENLKCTNKSALIGNFDIPSTIDGKTVKSIDASGFSDSNITGVKVPNTVQRIGESAFKNCKNLKTVDLGNITTLDDYAFQNCTALETITIPKTLNNSSVLNNEVFNGCTNLKEIIFEEGLTDIRTRLCANTVIESVKIPSTVKSIHLGAFRNCKNLKNVDLGNITTLDDYAFQNCTALETITIPKTLNNSSVLNNEVFNGCTNLKEIIFEEGLTDIRTRLCANTVIESVKIPSTVKSIHLGAFRNCKNLKTVDLGNITTLDDYAFENCTALETITIPKTLKSSSVLDRAVFNGCTNLKEIKFEEGLTNIRTRLCASTVIESVELPNSVERIETNAFSNCPNLTKITIPAGVKKIHDNAFQNHNLDLTIYCYEGSVAAQYAIDNNIKYVYLTEPKVEALEVKVKYSEKDKTTGKVTVTITTNKKVSQVDGWTLSEDGRTLTKDYSKNAKESVSLVAEDGQKKMVLVIVSSFAESQDGSENVVPTDKDNTETDNKANNQSSNKSDNTVAPSKLPQTGVKITIVFTVIALGIVTIISLNKIKEYKEIK